MHMLKCEQVNIYMINCDIMLPMPAHAVVHFALSPTYTVHCRIVNTPATAKLAIAVENKRQHCLAFFSASQKTLKIILIR